MIETGTEVPGGGGVGAYTYSNSCDHQNDIDIKVGSFRAELMFHKLCRAKSQRQCPLQNDNVCRERSAEAGSRTEVRPLTSLVFYHWAKPALHLLSSSG